MSVNVVVVFAVIFSLTQVLDSFSTQDEFSVAIIDGRCVLESKGSTKLTKMNGEWYDTAQCMMYGCRTEGGKAVVTQHRCNEQINDNCWMRKTTGNFPSCCYGEGVLCDESRRRDVERKSLLTNRFRFW